MKKFLLTVLILLVISLVGFFGIGIIVQIETRENIAKIRFHPATLEKLKDSYEDISKIDAFFPIGDTKDAGVVLNQYISLDTEGSVPIETTWWNTISDVEKKNIKKEWLSNPESIEFPEDDLLRVEPTKPAKG